MNILCCSTNAARRKYFPIYREVAHYNQATINRRNSIKRSIGNDKSCVNWYVAQESYTRAICKLINHVEWRIRAAATSSTARTIIKTGWGRYICNRPCYLIINIISCSSTTKIALPVTITYVTFYFFNKREVFVFSLTLPIKCMTKYITARVSIPSQIIRIITSPQYPLMPFIWPCKTNTFSNISTGLNIMNKYRIRMKCKLI